jgi:hypothetical protein
MQAVTTIGLDIAKSVFQVQGIDAGEPTLPETVYVPYYEPSVVYGTWDYPDYPSYYFEPAPGYVLGGAIATGIAWGAAFAIGNAVWDSCDWGNGKINIDIDKNYNFNRHVDRNNVKVEHWQHNAYHRHGVSHGQPHRLVRASMKRSSSRGICMRNRQGCHARIVTHLQDATDNLFGIVQRFHDHRDEEVKPHTAAANAKELYFGLLDSGYLVATAGSREVGRSERFQLFHGQGRITLTRRASACDAVCLIVSSPRRTLKFAR